MNHLLTGPFLPPAFRAVSAETSEVDFSTQPEKLLFFLESAQGHKHDLITELVATGKWQHAVWIVRALLEPSFEYPSSIVTQNVFDGTRYTSLGDTREDPASRPGDTSVPSHVIAGRSGLWTIKDTLVKRDIERRRRGFGIVLGSLAGMVLRAGEQLKGGGDRLGDQHTDLLPTARQILAYCHTASLMPENLYAVDRYPRLHILRPRILASLADAVWRAREAVVAAEAAALGIFGEHRGMEVPKARYTLSVWGSGTKDMPDFAVAEPHHPKEQIPHAEREAWLELILTVMVEAGYGNAAATAIKYMSSMASRNVPHNTWSFIDYSARYPREYTPENIARMNREPKSDIVERWGLEGHSLLPPLVTTLPLTLPDWILPAIADAIVDSTAEGRGLESMFRSILSYARALPMRRETVLRLLRHPALTWSKSAETMEAGAALLWQFGDRWKAANMYYTSLALHVAADNLPGAMRVWLSGIAQTRVLRETPNRITGMYLTLLVRRRQLGQAWDLIRHVDGMPPTISEEIYSVPTLAPGLLALAIQSHSKALYRSVVAAVADGRHAGRWITRATYTSVLNAHLEFGSVAAARQVLLDMKEDGIEADGVAVAVLVRHELERDVDAGYRLAERESGSVFAGGGGGGDEYDQQRHGVGFSRDAWTAVLDYAVAGGSAQRAGWALEGRGIEIETGAGLDTVAFNILLRGVALREGCYRAMQMCHRYHTRGDRGDGVVVGDALSFRTVLHSAVRELVAMDRREKVSVEVRKVELRAIMESLEEKQERRKKEKEKGKQEKGKQRSEVEDVIRWCWEEMRGSGMRIDDVVDTVRQKLWQRMGEGENWRQAKNVAEKKTRADARKKVRRT